MVFRILANSIKAMLDKKENAVHKLYPDWSVCSHPAGSGSSKEKLCSKNIKGNF